MWAQVQRAPQYAMRCLPWLSETRAHSTSTFCATCGNDMTGRVATKSFKGILCVFCGAQQLRRADTFTCGQVEVLQQTSLTLLP